MHESDIAVSQPAQTMLRLCRLQSQLRLCSLRRCSACAVSDCDLKHRQSTIELLFLLGFIPLSVCGTQTTYTNAFILLHPVSDSEKVNPDIIEAPNNPISSAEAEVEETISADDAENSNRMSSAEDLGYPTPCRRHDIV